MNHKFLRKSPFWPLALQELKYHNYSIFVVTQDGTDFVITIDVARISDGAIKQKTYKFPVQHKSFSAPKNFRSQFRNFLKHTLPEEGYAPPPDHRVRRAGMFIAKINHDVPKKELVPPKAPIVVESPPIPQLEPPMPTVTEVKPNVDPIVMSFLVNDPVNMPLIMDILKDVAVFRGAKPLSELMAAKRTPSSTIPPAAFADEPKRRTRSPHVGRDILKLMRNNENGKKVWTSDTVHQYLTVYSKTQIAGALSTLCMSDLNAEPQVERLDRGLYRLVQKSA